MRLSDLLNAEVLDERGARIGHVHDVRVVRDGPVLGDFGAAFRVKGFVVGRPALGARLGLDRADVRGPWLLKAFFAWIRTDLYVDWERVRSIEEGRMRIRGVEGALPHAAAVE
jgi:sporulation protein YlmC with PRC-barrel domain